MGKKKNLEYNEAHFDFVKNEVKKGSKVTPATKKMCKKFGLNYSESLGRVFRRKMQRAKVTENARVIEDTSQFKNARAKVFNKSKKTFLITWAQNSTPVHQNFLRNLLSLSEQYKADLHVIAGRYRNPTSVFTDAKKDAWAEEVVPYLDANRHRIHPLVQVLSDVKISPTASTPLSGLNGITGLETCIVGHPRQHLKSLPVLSDYPNKLLLSTGACTLENYTDSKSGKLGEFHHVLGCVVVELDGDSFHVRQISATEDGNFYDLFYRVVDGVVYENKEGAEFAVMGDIHLMEEDQVALNAAFLLLDRMKPSHTMLHDLFSAVSLSPHDKKNPFVLLHKERQKKLSLSAEINYMINWLEQHKKYNLVVVRGNHCDMFDRWLSNSDWRNESNKYEYFKYGKVLADGGARKGIVPYIIDKAFGEDIKTLGLDDSYRVLDWELALHGHLGASGSRASPVQLKRLNTKNVTAHSHSPHREDGHLRVGTLTKLRMGFNKGLSPWMHGLALGYANGHVQLINIIGGKYTALVNAFR